MDHSLGHFSAKINIVSNNKNAAMHGKNLTLISVYNLKILKSFSLIRSLRRKNCFVIFSNLMGFGDRHGILFSNHNAI